MTETVPPLPPRKQKQVQQRRLQKNGTAAASRQKELLTYNQVLMRVRNLEMALRQLAWQLKRSWAPDGVRCHPNLPSFKKQQNRREAYEDIKNRRLPREEERLRTFQVGGIHPFEIEH